MYDIERRDRIIEILREKKSCSVAELAYKLSFSQATIRRDLAVLEKEMKISKTFGGAVIRDNFPTEVPLSLRRDDNSAVKAAICAAASSLLKDNITLFLDSSSTVEYILPYLTRYKGLTVITNNPEIPVRLAETEINIYSTGGKFLHHSQSYVGEFAQNMLRGINADILFFSARGIDSEGKVTNSSTEDDIHKIMIKNSALSCLLFDSSKLGRTYPFTICNISDIGVLVTDKPLTYGLKHKNVILI